MQPIYIIGTGAIGKALAVFLKLANKNVVLIRGSVDDQPSENQNLKIVLRDEMFLEASLEVCTLSNFEELKGIIVLANKSFGNSQLAKSLKEKTGESPIVILQNGLDIEQPFIENSFPHIYRCVLFATSQNFSRDTLSFKPVATSPVGVIKGTKEKLKSIIAELDSPNFPFKSEADIQPIIWKKAIANSVFNSVCPLLNIDNGIFDRNETALNIAKRIVTECVAIAREMKVSLKVEEVMESLAMISKASDGQLISTLQDINNRRKTEIETLNFSIVEIARKLEMEKEVAETKLLGELTLLKSDLNR